MLHDAVATLDRRAAGSSAHKLRRSSNAAFTKRCHDAVVICIASDVRAANRWRRAAAGLAAILLGGCAATAAMAAMATADPALSPGMAMPGAAMAGGPGRAAPLPAGGRLIADVPYGESPRQRFDLYLPPRGGAPAQPAPILVMVHGGAWMFGDKASRGVAGDKMARWVGKGGIFVSLNNRLWPEAAPLVQAEDVARAVAMVQTLAASWGGDPRQLVLMGHSAGAHLVALLGASPSLAARFGAQRWSGTVVLDSAALDLPGLMRQRHARFYDRVFGGDAAAWRDASPADRLGADAPPMLLVCSTLRSDDSCGQADRFAARAVALRVSARVQREALSHAAINVELGSLGPYSDAVDAFTDSVLTAAR